MLLLSANADCFVRRQCTHRRGAQFSPVEVGGEVGEDVLQPEPQMYLNELRLSASSMWHRRAHAQRCMGACTAPSLTYNDYAKSPMKVQRFHLSTADPCASSWRTSLLDAEIVSIVSMLLTGCPKADAPCRKYSRGECCCPVARRRAQGLCVQLLSANADCSVKPTRLGHVFPKADTAL